MARLVVLLPCYNEEQALPGLLERLLVVATQLGPAYALKVLVINDGSSDRTAEIARAAHVELIEHARNRGLGAAVQTGIAQAEQEGFELLAVMDADGTHPPELLRTMLAKLEADQLDVVIGSRFAPGGSTTRAATASTVRRRSVERARSSAYHL